MMMMMMRIYEDDHGGGMKLIVEKHLPVFSGHIHVSSACLRALSCLREHLEGILFLLEHSIITVHVAAWNA